MSHMTIQERTKRIQVKPGLGLDQEDLEWLDSLTINEKYDLVMDLLRGVRDYFVRVQERVELLRAGSA